MLIELVQSILDTINSGGIPVIENSWRYVMKNECVKKGKELVENLAKELREHRDKNKNRKDFYINIKNDIALISQKYLNEFINNNLLDEEMTKEYVKEIAKEAAKALLIE
jgi:F0F1-type ATP synthase delta subunit